MGTARWHGAASRSDTAGRGRRCSARRVTRAGDPGPGVEKSCRSETLLVQPGRDGRAGSVIKLRAQLPRLPTCRAWPVWDRRRAWLRLIDGGQAPAAKLVG